MQAANGCSLQCDSTGTEGHICSLRGARHGRLISGPRKAHWGEGTGGEEPVWAVLNFRFSSKKGLLLGADNLGAEEGYGWADIFLPGV